MAPRCPLCQSPSAAPFFEQRGRAYHACDRCDLRFLDPAHRLSADQERARYLRHRNDVSDPGYRAFVRPLFDHMVERVPPGAVGLDFGAGPGPVLADMFEAAGYQIRLFDPFFHPVREHLDRRYDFIVACEVVEHLFNPREEFHTLKGLLNDGGILGIMTWLWTPDVRFADWHGRRDTIHVAFYSETTFRWLEEALGFQSVSFEGPRVVLLRA